MSVDLLVFLIVFFGGFFTATLIYSYWNEGQR